MMQDMVNTMPPDGAAMPLGEFQEGLSAALPEGWQIERGCNTLHLVFNACPRDRAGT
jgi:hypothetical protein